MFSDLLVIETAGVLAAPLVGQFLAEWGARVVKVENPASMGDVTRRFKLASESADDELSAYFCSINWGKSSIALDLTRETDQRILLDLLGRADIWLDNYRPGALERLGLKSQEILECNPRLIHARISAFGDDDERPGYDAAIQACAGFMGMNGTAESGPLKFPVALVDVQAAHQLKEGVLMALLHREKTGVGGTVSASLFESAVSMLVNQAINSLKAGEVPWLEGSEHPNIVPYGKVFHCRDGKPVVLANGTDGQFERLCRVLDLTDMPADDRFATNLARVKNRELVNNRLQQRIEQMDRATLMDNLAEHAYPAAPIRSVREVLDDDISQNLLLQDSATHDELVWGLKTSVFKFGGEQGEAESLAPPPKLDQHREHVLRDVLEYPEKKLKQLCCR
jgi:crotonobetainyl-CoA:carnitine CoA-transferase CaiB-like acyl-CoA transferase